MDRQTWKKWEREWANMLPQRSGNSSERIPVTGRNDMTTPDISHHDFAVECKVGKVLSSRQVKGIRQAKASAEASKTLPKKLPIVVQSHKIDGERDMLHAVTMPYDAWVRMARIYLSNTERVNPPDLGI
tara:strand:+ start:661 stop:1047 length:387 start_codon:yes stop_codon:yes gene_type:complete